ncbi:hypothetical protein ACFL2V_13235, partial [Pseudomonadota bacterium]
MSDGSYKQSQRLLGEQTRMLYDAAWTSSLASLVNGSILVFVLWSVVDHLTLTIWLLVLVLVMATRLSIYRLYRKASSSETKIVPWARCVVGGSLAAALLWGGAVIWLFPSDSIGHQVFVAFVIGGMCASAVTNLSFLKIPVLAYLTLTLVPLGIQFLLSDSSLSLAMSFMILLFLGITVMSALRIYDNTALNITLRFEAADREKALCESEERYRSIFESAPLGVVHYDADGVVQSCNPMLTNQ